MKIFAEVVIFITKLFQVLSAGPAIDNREPATRSHLLIKLKKHQKEKERHAKIERDNFSLLRNLAYIMRTNRVDNSWSTPQPKFNCQENC